MPLGTTFYATTFGMVTDRFGVLWMVLALRPSFAGTAEEATAAA
jgi:uncharacterized glyoxalase superfamily protein PhnB